jgi:hypothetical protein
MLNNLKNKLLKKLESKVLKYFILNGLLINFIITFIIFCFVCNSTVLFKLTWLFLLLVTLTLILHQIDEITIYGKNCEITFKDESNLYNYFYKLSNYYNNRFAKVIILVSPFFLYLLLYFYT